jgi:hypothetical protein
MAAAFVATPHLAIRQAIAIGTHEHADLPSSVEGIESNHFPDSKRDRGNSSDCRCAERSFG